MFNDYVDKIRWVGGQKCLFLSMFRVRIVHIKVGRWSKKGQNWVHAVIEWPLDANRSGFRVVCYDSWHEKKPDPLKFCDLRVPDDDTKECRSSLA